MLVHNGQCSLGYADKNIKILIIIVVVPMSVSPGGFVCQLFRCTPVLLSSLLPCKVKYIRKNHGDYFGISVAGYPEGHPNRIKEVGWRCACGLVLSFSNAESAEGRVWSDVCFMLILCLCLFPPDAAFRHALVFVVCLECNNNL